MATPQSSIPVSPLTFDVQAMPVLPVQITSGAVTLSTPTTAAYLTGASLTFTIPSVASYVAVFLNGKDATVSAAATITTGLYLGASAGTLTTLVGDSVVVAPTGGTTVAVNSVFWIPVTNATAGTTVTVSVGITASSGNYVLNNGATEPTTLAALIF